MADPNPTRLFDRWESVDSDYQFVLQAMQDLGFQDYCDLSLSDQQLTLALALMKKRAWFQHLTPQMQS